MNEAEKERLIKKDIASIENRVRHAFNQGYEMGLKERQNSCSDAISRAEFEKLIKPYDTTDAMDKALYNFAHNIMMMCKSVTPQQRTGRWIDAEVLEKIRAEIDSHCSDNRDRNDGLYIAMKIIDKYRSESEDKE